MECYYSDSEPSPLPDLNPTKCRLSRNEWADDSIDLELVRDIANRMILHWNYRNLKEVPRELLEYGDHVREVYLKRNCLDHLPNDLGKLSNLTNIYISGNNLANLPEEIGQLQNLEVLNVSENDLETIPGTVGNLGKLQQLVLTNNRIRSLPLNLKKLHKLQYLEVSNNRLTLVPEQITHGLQDLREFCVDGNPLQFLPRNLPFLPKLKYVSACKCDLRLLPAIPFHCLVSNRLNYTRGTLRFNQQHHEYFQFRFDGNENLLYIPFWLLRVYGSQLESYGCGGVGVKGERKKYLKLPCVMDAENPKAHFQFDPCLEKIHWESEPPSLVECTLRHLFENRELEPNDVVEENWSDQLPAVLSDALIVGPVCHCFQCMTPIFTEMWPLIFRLQTDVVALEVAELVSPNCAINAYNHRQLNAALQAGGVKRGFHYAFIGFCSYYCQQVFHKINTCSPFLPFHDMVLIVKNQVNLKKLE